MKKNVGLTYVSEFSFPPEQGFTGSAGKQPVKGYMRGGHVKKTGTPNAKHGDYKHGGKMEYGEGGYYGKPGDKYPKSKALQKMPKNVKKKGGYAKKMQMGGYMGPEREISVDDVKISVPKKHGGKMSTHDKLKAEGAKMGYAYGGQVKDTSDEFMETRGKQDSMDYGNQPARRGRNQAEIEAGGTKKLKPALKKGGYMKGGVHRTSSPYLKKKLAKGTTSAKKGGYMKGGMHSGDMGNYSEYAGSRRKASKKGMPKTVKHKGGLMEYAHGGYAAGDKMSHPTGRGRKPYAGYNKQPGGSGNEDARYMQGKK